MLRPFRSTAIALLLAGATAALLAQGRDPRQAVEAEKAAMARLDYMPGTWAGTGWMDLPAGRRTFHGTETIQSKLGGIALLIEGDFVGVAPGADHETSVHQTLGVISYDPRAQKYRFLTWLASGMSGEHELVLHDDGWEWGFDIPSGRIRYTMKKTAADEWFEIGERSADGKEWAKFFEMTLKKK
jgi:hypothetical protein